MKTPKDNVDYFIITDIDGFANDVRSSVFDELSSDWNDTEQMDDFITIAQIEEILDKNSDFHDEEGNPAICLESYENIFRIVSLEVTNSGLSKLAAEGVIEVAFDEELNDFVFWKA